MSMPPNTSRFLQDLAPQWARLGLWQKKFTVVFERLRSSTVQKISASDDGFLILNLYKPGAPREPALISLQRSGSGLTLGSARPQTQPKPNSLVQVARKYLQGRKIEQVLLCLDPLSVVMEFSAVPESFDEAKDWPPDAPNCLILDLDHRPPRVCVARKHPTVPERYADQCTGFTGVEDFFESHNEWSLENTKTKRRATFTHPLIFSCLRSLVEVQETGTQISPQEENLSEVGQGELSTEGLPFSTSAVPHSADSPASHGASSLGSALQGVATKSGPMASPVGIAPETLTLAAALQLLPTHVRRAARTRLQFLERRLQRQKADLPSTPEMELLKKRAEGLRAHIYMWPKDYPQWHVPPDLIESAGLPAIIRLKQGQSPGDVVNAAFDELDKLSRRRSELERRLEESRTALDRFESVVLQAGGDIVALPEEERNSALALARAVAHLAAVQRLLGQLEVTWTAGQQKSAAQEAERERRLPYRSFKASSGEFIRVSKSAADSDAMLKLMPSHHTWLHVVTGEGSHVWLEKPKGAKPSDTALREAAILAIHHSKQTRAQEADVYVALRGDVDKRKELAPGKVIVRRSEHRFIRYSQMELQAFLEKQE